MTASSEDNPIDPTPAGGQEALIAALRAQNAALLAQNAALDAATASGHCARQVFDLPAPQPLVVTEHRAHQCRCQACGTHTRAAFPEGVTAPVQYGPRIAAVVIYLSNYQLLPEKRLAEAMADLFGVSLARATIAAMSRSCAARLGSFVAMLHLFIAASPVKHLDETGFRIGGKTMWLHIASTLKLTLYRAATRRSSLSEGLAGIVVHDHFKPYYQLKGVLHALCNAHHLRELQALVDIEREDWAARMQRLLRRASHATHLARTCDKRLSPALIALFERAYDRIIREGLAFHDAQPALIRAAGKDSRGRTPRRVGHNLLRRLDERRDDVLRFLSNPDVPFTNNLAERDARMMKLRQKISGGFRSTQGAEDFAAIRSLISEADPERFQNGFLSHFNGLGFSGSSCGQCRKKRLRDFSGFDSLVVATTRRNCSMAWTEITRAKYRRDGLRYASDTIDAEWVVIEPYLPQPARCGRRRKTGLRDVVDAIFYIAQTGCQWRLLPKDFRPYTTVQRYFYLWRDSGLWQTINHVLLMNLREAAGREASPTGGVIDSQSVKTTESGGPRGYAAEKMIKGRKRHLLTDTIGLPVGMIVHPANVQDRDGAPALLESIRDAFPWLRHVFADGGYSGQKLTAALENLGDWTIEIVKRCDVAKGFVLLPRRWVVERTFAWLNRNRRLAKDVEATVESAVTWLYIASVKLMSRRLAAA